MRLITFTRSGSSTPEIGARIPNSSGDLVLPFSDVAQSQGIKDFPVGMRDFLRAGSKVMEQAKAWVKTIPESATPLLLQASSITYL